MHLKQVTPVPCTVCGKGNTPRNDGLDNVFVDLERDVNWNDPVILCEDCAVKVGAIVGMLTPDARNDLENIIKKKDKEIHDLKADLDLARVKAVRVRQSRTKVAS